MGNNNIVSFFYVKVKKLPWQVAWYAIHLPMTQQKSLDICSDPLQNSPHASSSLRLACGTTGDTQTPYSEILISWNYKWKILINVNI